MQTNERTALLLHDALHNVQQAMASPASTYAELNAVMAVLNEALFQQTGATRVAYVVLAVPQPDNGYEGRIRDIVGLALFTAERRIAENPAIVWPTSARSTFDFIFEHRGFFVVPHRDRLGDRPPTNRKRTSLQDFQDGWGVDFRTVLP